MSSRIDELSTHLGKKGTEHLTAHHNRSDAEVTDKELVERFRNGEKDTFEKLVRRHQKRIYWLARRIVRNHDDADDVVQDVLVKVYGRLAGFRGESSFSTWLYRITVNTAIGVQRRKKTVEWLRLESLMLGGTSPRHEESRSNHLAPVNGASWASPRRGPPWDEYRPRKLGISTVSSGQDVLHSLEVEEQRSIIEQAIARLPKKQRLVFLLRYYEELPYSEISKILKTSVGGLKANYYHAVRKIAAYVKAAYGSGTYNSIGLRHTSPRSPRVTG